MADGEGCERLLGNDKRNETITQSTRTNRWHYKLLPVISNYIHAYKLRTDQIHQYHVTSKLILFPHIFLPIY